MERINPNPYFKLIPLLPDLDIDLLTSILCIWYASHIALLDRNLKTSLGKTLWDMIEKAEPGEYINIIVDALYRITPDFPWLNILINAVKRIKPEETALRETIEMLSNIECNSITVSDIYENKLSMEVWQSSRLSGDFYTPASVVHMMVKLLDIKEGSIYDPCCGSGAMLCRIFMEHPELEFYGQTADEQTYKICQANAFLRGQHINLGGKPANVFLEDVHSCRGFDYIISNPPFNASKWCDELCFNDPRWRYGIPPRSNANFAWLQLIISHLSCHGRAAVILPNGSLTTSVESERHIREKILCAGLVEAVIALPPSLFYTTKVPCSLWLLDKSRVPEETVLLVDSRHLLLRETTELSRQNISQLHELLRHHRTRTLQRKTDWYADVPLSEIALRDYNLSPNLYTKKSRIQIRIIQKRQSRFKEIVGLLSSQIKETDISKLVRQWKTIEPSSQWEKAFFLELYETFGGITKPKKYFGHGVGMIDVRTVIHNYFVPDTLTAYVDADNDEMKKYQIKAGDILLNRTSETIEELACGCVAPEDSHSVYSAFVKRLRPIHKGLLNPFYMAGYLNSAIYRQEVEKVATIYTTRANINIKQLSKISIYFPKLSMQQKLGNTIFELSQFQKEETNKKLIELSKEFIDLLIEQYITYPVLCIQNREGIDT